MSKKWAHILKHFFVYLTYLVSMTIGHTCITNDLNQNVFEIGIKSACVLHLSALCT